MVNHAGRIAGFWKLASFGFFSLGLLLAPGARAESKPVIIYTYDSFVADGGAGPTLKASFQKAHPECALQFKSYGDGAQLVNRLEIERSPQADLVVGVDQNTWLRAKSFARAIPRPLTPRVEKIPARFQQAGGFIPMDYGAFSLIGDFARDPTLKDEISLRDLMLPAWRNRIALIDPRTSTPGFAFLAFTRDVLGEKDFATFWRALRDNWFQLSTGWDQAYQLFVGGKVATVWSYTTSEAYHRKKGEKSRRAIRFKEGQPLQIEGFFYLGEPSPCGVEFGALLLSDEGQRTLAETNWMLPIVESESVSLPDSFKGLAQPRREVLLTKTAAESTALLTEWRQILAR